MKSIVNHPTNQNPVLKKAEKPAVTPQDTLDGLFRELAAIPKVKFNRPKPEEAN